MKLLRAMLPTSLIGIQHFRNSPRLILVTQERNGSLQPRGDVEESTGVLVQSCCTRILRSQGKLYLVTFFLFSLARSSCMLPRLG